MEHSITTNPLSGSALHPPLTKVHTSFPLLSPVCMNSPMQEGLPKNTQSREVGTLINPSNSTKTQNESGGLDPIVPVRCHMISMTDFCWTDLRDNLSFNFWELKHSIKVTSQSELSTKDVTPFQDHN